MVKNIDSQTWDEEVTKADKPVVVDFWHEQCIWCQRLNPIYEELAKEYDKAKLTKLNIRSNEENLDIAMKYGVDGTPTLKVFCKGRVIGEVVGFMKKVELKIELDRIIEKSDSCINQSTKI